MVVTVNRIIDDANRVLKMEMVVQKHVILHPPPLCPKLPRILALVVVLSNMPRLDQLDKSELKCFFVPRSSFKLQPPLP